MFVKLLGILDIFIAVCFWIFGVFHIFPEKFITILGIILLIKGIIFIIGLSIASIIDIVCALIIIIAASVNVPLVMTVLVALFLLQKGLFSLAS